MTTSTVVIIIIAAIVAVVAAVLWHRAGRIVDAAPDGDDVPCSMGQVHEDNDGSFHAMCICGWEEHHDTPGKAVSALVEHSTAGTGFGTDFLAS